jgi:hypothetical protein
MSAKQHTNYLLPQISTILLALDSASSLQFRILAVFVPSCLAVMRQISSVGVEV